MPNTNENSEYEMISALRQQLYKIFIDVEKAWMSFAKAEIIVRVK